MKLTGSLQRGNEETEQIRRNMQRSIESSRGALNSGKKEGCSEDRREDGTRSRQAKHSSAKQNAGVPKHWMSGGMAIILPDVFVLQTFS